MRIISAIMWKEMRSFLRDRLASLVLLLVVLFFAVFYPWQFGDKAILGAALFAVFAGIYSLTWTAFNGERLSKTITSLLAAPVGIRQLFLGKIIAVFLVTYALVLLSLVISEVIVWFRFGEFPSAPIILASLVTFPIWGVVFSQLLGLVYILFGNPFILRLLMILVLVVIINFGSLGELNILLFSPALLIPTGIGVATLLFFLLGRLDKERVARA